MKSIFFFLIFSLSLFAIDVSDFDINGIKLGMNVQEAFEKMPCANPDKHNDKLSNGKIASMYSRCLDDKGDVVFLVESNHNGLLHRITKRITFKVKPNFQKIKNKLWQKYGKADIVTKFGPGYINKLFKGYIKEFCWGKSCTIKQEDGKYFEGNTIVSSSENNIHFHIEYRDGTFDGEIKNYIKFSFYNPKMQMLDYEWKEKEDLIYQKQQKEKASNIDF